jgi:hypothetical protein
MLIRPPLAGGFLVRLTQGSRTREGATSPLACRGVRSEATNPMSLAAGKAANPPGGTMIIRPPLAGGFFVRLTPETW